MGRAARPEARQGGRRIQTVTTILPISAFDSMLSHIQSA
jgi:hypothetical protein